MTSVGASGINLNLNSLLNNVGTQANTSIYANSTQASGTTQSTQSTSTQLDPELFNSLLAATDQSGGSSMNNLLSSLLNPSGNNAAGNIANNQGNPLKTAETEGATGAHYAHKGGGHHTQSRPMIRMIPIIPLLPSSSSISSITRTQLHNRKVRACICPA